MNGRCETCDVEKECGYKYKPCLCCNYRKFKPKEPAPSFSGMRDRWLKDEENGVCPLPPINGEK